ncbi:hypothetical protein DPEC_G00306430 [Dallia pectoralis]|uniref:Uncharacterized protein n=1 Tax=Dallia pectoralis TaxID=75939 RepID=A0ACC2FE27_DALPE|nr:hypothetical protein DPEC_G00306430 [Dallia pectoralis]
MAVPHETRVNIREEDHPHREGVSGGAVSTRLCLLTTPRSPRPRPWPRPPPWQCLSGCCVPVRSPARSSASRLQQQVTWLDHSGAAGSVRAGGGVAKWEGGLWEWFWGALLVSFYMNSSTPSAVYSLSHTVPSTREKW